MQDIFLAEFQSIKPRAISNNRQTICMITEKNYNIKQIGKDIGIRCYLLIECTECRDSRMMLCGMWMCAYIGVA